MSNELRLRLLLADEDATVRLARLLAASQPDPAVVYLGGNLGAGKSTLARAWLRSLGVEGTIRSPTYTLVERYRLGDSEALHLDLYRIGSGAELEFLGLDEAPARLWLVEWPERGAGGLPAADLEVGLAISGSGREAVLRAGSEAGRGWLGALADGGQLAAFPEP
ncbi:tRNA (adenosine(37)-N6)-threonylcarbamoyltransferase complex ATPase subunit type 1 TsaE [Luteimonas dalianensis]|uniref:tRNA (adenosine(37)-N6)-threonylcarbamoyltransferase complex ATPase subunit type 1 TsaE n=1 Tax=Luteimonas dalianensis TaxID=1148196 RepID=UPI003BF18732